MTESSKTDCALSVTGPYESTAIVTGPMPRKPKATTVESFHHSVPSPRSLTKSHEARYVIAIDTKDVSHTSRVNGASKFMRATPAYWARTQASLIKYDAPLATIISTRIKKIQTRSCTCTAGSLTASRMNEMSATPVTP